MQLHHTVTGDGPPLVLLHGWQDDHTVWSGVVDELSTTHRCIGVDLPGHGRSLVESFDDYERDAVLRSLDPIVAACDVPPVLVGHSLGGFLSLSYAISRPGSVAGLALVATGPGYRSEGPREAWNEWVRTHANPGAPDGQERICFQHDALVIDGLPDVDVPAVVIVGDRDTQYFAAVSVFEKKLGEVQTVTIADAGHNVHKRRPAETAAAIRRILDA